ncbi:hypothetical protein ILUMI_11908 [Ignelater luminosus]|uniref:DUF7802 domain-containing protein n=1 Tax=Ignelater luminosus TaxID=2038154 RepID=A0A8K0GA22_IGNLU|nr:hypothetical protein ILUMI_11908 [Ignelater luminosus]
MFLGRRLPLHIIMLYPCFIYNASIAVGKMRLPRWAEPFAVGLCVVLTDIPYDIVSVNFLHWTWHDTDPNIYDRHYWVPWNSYYFHACFAAGFIFWFHFTRRLICKTEKWEADKLPKELLCTVIASLLGAPSGILLFLPNYHPLHDIFKVHSEVTFFIIFTVFLLIVWTADRQPKHTKSTSTEHKTYWSTWLLILHLFIHYGSFLGIVSFMKPENEIAIGLKEPIGPCNEYAPVQTAFGMVLKKRKYLCVTDYDEKYFDFHCLPNGKPPSHGASWYTACGVPLPNYVEYVAIIATICLLGFGVYGNLHFRSGGDAVFDSATSTTQTKSKKIKQKRN